MKTKIQNNNLGEQTPLMKNIANGLNRRCFNGVLFSLLLLGFSCTARGKDLLAEEVFVCVAVDADTNARIKNMRCEGSPKTKKRGVWDFSSKSNKDGVFHLRLKKGVAYDLTFLPSLKAPYCGIAHIPAQRVVSTNVVEFSVVPAFQIKGKVVDEKGNPLPELKVLAIHYKNKFNLNGMQALTRIDKKGCFSLFLNSPLWLKAPVTLDVDTINDKYRVKERIVDYKKGDPLILVAKIRPPTVYCMMLDEHGKKMVLENTEMRPIYNHLTVFGPLKQGSHPYCGTSITKNGMFKLDDLLPGRYQVEFEQVGYRRHLKKNTFEVPVKGNIVKFTVVEKKVPTSIKLVDLKTGDVISNVTVTVFQDGLPFEPFLSDKDGMIHFDAYPGVVRTKFYSKGYFHHPDVKLKTGETTVVKLERGEELVGVILNEDKKAVTNATLTLIPSQSSEQTKRTDANGSFKFIGLKKGKAKLLLTAKGYATTAKRVIIGAEKNMSIELQHGVEVTFDIQLKIKRFLGEDLEKGKLLIIQQPLFAFVGTRPCTLNSTSKLFLNPGIYDIAWVGKKAAFIIQQIKVGTTNSTVKITIKKPSSKEIYTVKKLFERFLEKVK